MSLKVGFIDKVLYLINNLCYHVKKDSYMNDFEPNLISLYW